MVVKTFRVLKGLSNIFLNVSKTISTLRLLVKGLGTLLDNDQKSENF